LDVRPETGRESLTRVKKTEMGSWDWRAGISGAGGAVFDIEGGVGLAVAVVVGFRFLRTRMPSSRPEGILRSVRVYLSSFYAFTKSTCLSVVTSQMLLIER
jgi:hypothetical protein